MAKSVLARVLIKNGLQLLGGVVKEHINCEFARVQGLYWLVPMIKSGILQYYKPVISAAKPTVDSVNSVRIKVGESTYYLALTDGGTAQVFNDACNACCEAVTPMPDVVVPAALLEVVGCTDANGNYYYTDLAPALVAGEVYQAIGSLEGVAFINAQDAGYASVAAFQAWAAGNWAAYGTWTNPAGQKSVLTNATKKTGFIKLVRAKFFESNAPAGLAAGHHYTLDATIDGAVLPQLVGAPDAALSTLATAANANASWAAYGRWSVVAGKVRLVSQVATTVAIVATNV